MPPLRSGQVRLPREGVLEFDYVVVRQRGGRLVGAGLAREVAQRAEDARRALAPVLGLPAAQLLQRRQQQVERVERRRHEERALLLHALGAREQPRARIIRRRLLELVALEEHRLR